MGKHSSNSERKHKHSSKHHKKAIDTASSEKSSRIIDDAVDDDEWVEAPAPTSFAGVQTIPTSQSLSMTTSHVAEQRPDYLGMQASTKAREPKDTYGTFSVRSGAGRGLTELSASEMTDGYGADESGSMAMSVPKQDFELFSSMGSERKRQPKELKADPAKPKMSKFELNTDYFNSKEGKSAPQDALPVRKKIEAGSAGSPWRMTKLKRTYEAAEEEQRPIEEVALERYGSLDDWHDALEERRILDERANPQLKESREQAERLSRGEIDQPQVDEFGREIRGERTPARKLPSEKPRSTTKFLFTQNNSGLDTPGTPTESRPPSRNAFRRPGSYNDLADTSMESSASSTVAQQGSKPPSRFSTPKVGTPVPSVFTPPVVSRNPSSLRQAESAAGPEGAKPIMARSLSPTSLNRLQAKVLKAKLMAPDTEATKALEREYETESARAREQPAGSSQGVMIDDNGQAKEVRLLPTLDGRGKLYDVGVPGSSSESTAIGSKRKRGGERAFETHDKSGKIVRYNGDDDTTTLEDMVRHERFGAGAADQKDMDMELAMRIGTDHAFQNDLEYMDDAAERLARKKLKTADQKRLFAIQDFAKTKKALDSCVYCYQDTEDKTVLPQVPMIALGTRAYLALGRYEGLTEDHCYIVPLQHCLTSLEADDDTWEEIKNFMKTLTQMFAHQEKGIVFYETVINLRWQKHTVIECVPLPWNLYEDTPAYFKEGIMMAESEWSTNKRLIDFSKRPGGFRRAMVPDLPYFMVQFDYKGLKGYGHVIEGHDGVQGGEDGFDVDEAEKGGGKFEKFFAAEIIGNLLEAEPRKWRKPRRLDPSMDASRVKAFKQSYDTYDWTKMLAVQ